MNAINKRTTGQIFVTSLSGCYQAGRGAQNHNYPQRTSATKLIPVNSVSVGKRIGIAKGVLEMPDMIDTHNEEMARLFMGEKGVKIQT